MSDDFEFTMPAVDDDPATEIGVLLMGFGPDRLLAGLGTAESVDDPALATLLVDQLRHAESVTDAVAAGVRVWRLRYPALAGARPAPDTPSASLRARWLSASRLVAAAAGPQSPAQHAYLTACWLRRIEIGKVSHGISQLPA